MTPAVLFALVVASAPTGGIDAFERRLSASDAEQRFLAVYELGQAANAGRLPAAEVRRALLLLLDRMADADPLVARQAQRQATALLRGQHRAGLRGELARHITGPAGPRQRSALGVLGWLPNPSSSLLPAVVHAARHGEPGARLLAVRLLRPVPVGAEADVVAVLLENRHHPDSGVRSEALSRLAGMPREQWQPAALALVRRDLAEIDLAARHRGLVVALLFDGVGVPLLVAVYRDGKQPAALRSSAAAALAQRDPAALLKVVDEAEPAVRRTALESLSSQSILSTGQPGAAVSAFVAAAGEKDVLLRSVALRGLIVLAANPKLTAQEYRAVVARLSAGMADPAIHSSLQHTCFSALTPDKLREDLTAADVAALLPRLLERSEGEKQTPYRPQLAARLALFVAKQKPPEALAPRLARHFETFKGNSQVMIGLIAVAPTSPLAIEHYVNLAGQSGPSTPPQESQTTKALRRIGRPAVDAILSHIEKNNAYVNQNLIAHLRVLGPDARPVVPALLARLERPNVSLGERQRIVETLVALGLAPERTVPLMAEFVAIAPRSLDPWIQKHADRLAPFVLDRLVDQRTTGGALKRLGAAALPAVRRAVADNNPDVRRAGLRGAIELRLEDAATLAALARHQGSSSFGYECRIALKGAGKAAVEPLVRTLRDGNPEQRVAALALLAEIEGAGAKVVLGAADSPHADVRARLAPALTYVKDPAATTALLKLLRDREAAVRVAAAAALHSHMRDGKGAVAAVRLATRDTDPGVRRSAVVGLVYNDKPADALPLLLPMLDDPVEAVRRDLRSMLAGLVGRLPEADRPRAVSKQVLPKLRTWLGGKDADQTDAARQLAALAGDVPQADRAGLVTLLRRLGRHPDLGARRAAVVARERLGDAIELEMLVDALGDTDWSAVPRRLAMAGLARRASDPGTAMADVRRIARVLVVLDQYDPTAGGELMTLLVAGRLPPEETEAIVLRLLDSAGVEDRARQIRKLGRSALPALLRALDEPQSTRWQVAMATLPDFGAEAAPALPAVQRFLIQQSSTYGEFHNRLKVVRAIGPASAPVLTAVIRAHLEQAALGHLYNAPTREVALACADVLAEFGEPAREALPLLARLGATQAVLKLALPELADPSLLAQAVAAEPYGSRHGLELLERLGPRAIPGLCGAVERLATAHPNPNPWAGDQKLRDMIRVLHRLAVAAPLDEQRRAARAFLVLQRSPHVWLRDAGNEALMTLGPAAMSVLPDRPGLSTFEHDGVLRQHVLRVLRNAPGEARWGLPLLLDSLPHEPALTAEALAAVGPEARAAVWPLCRRLNLGYPDYDRSRHRILIALGRIGPAARVALPAVMEALEDADPWTRLGAAEALWRITGDARPALPVLAALLDIPAAWEEYTSYGHVEHPRRSLRAARLAGDLLAEMAPTVAGVTPLLRERAKSTSASAAREAARALWLIDARNVPPLAVLREALLHGSPAERRRALDTFRRRPGPGVALAGDVLGRLRQPGGIEEAVALRLHHPAAERIGQLYRGQNHSYPSFPRVDAIRLLAPLGEAAIPVLQEMHAAEALGRLGAVALPALLELHRANQGPRGERLLALARLAHADGLTAAQVRAIHDLLLPPLSDPALPFDRDAAAAIGRLGAPALPAMLMAVRGGDRLLRLRGLEALGHLPTSPREALRELRLALTDADGDARRTAAEAMGRHGDRADGGAVMALLVALDDGRADVAAAAFAALAAIGDPAVPVVLAALGEMDATRQRRLFGVLEKMGPKAARATAPLVAMLGRADGERAAAALARIGPPAVGPLADALRQPTRRRHALRALAEMGPAARPAFAAIAAQLDDKDAVVRTAAATALSRMGEAAVPDLVRLLGHARAEVRRGAVAALTEIGPPALPAAPALLKAGREGKVPDVEAARALGRMGDAIIVPVMPLLADESARTRRLAALAVSFLIPDDQVYNHLTGWEGWRLRHEHPEHWNLHRALQQQRTAEKEASVKGPLLLVLNHLYRAGTAMEEIGPTLTDRDAVVRRRLLWLAGRQAIQESQRQPVRVALRDPDASARALAGIALARQGDYHVSALQEALSDRRPGVRRAAVQMLRTGKHCGKVVPALLRALDHPVMEARLEVLAALDEAGPAAATAAEVVRRLDDDRTEVALQAASLLAKHKRYPADRADALERLLTDGPRHYQARALLQGMGEAAAPLVAKLLRSRHNETRRAAAEWMAGQKQPPLDALEALRELTTDPNEETRRLAVRAMGKLGPTAAPALVEVFGWGGILVFNSSSRYEARTALREMGPAALPALLKAFRGPRDGLRLEVVGVLAELRRDEKGAAAFKLALGHADALVRREAALCLTPPTQGPWRDPLVELTPLLRDPAAVVRVAAVQRVVSLASRSSAVEDDKAIRAALQAALDDDAAEVVAAAASAVVVLGARAEPLLPRLERKLRRATEANERARWFATFGRLAAEAPLRRRLLATLTEYRGEEDPTARHALLLALQPLAGKPKLSDGEALMLTQCFLLGLRARSDQSRVVALNGLAAVGPRARPALPAVLALLDGPLSQQVAAVGCVWAIDPKSDRPWATVLNLLDRNHAAMILPVLAKSGPGLGEPAARPVLDRLTGPLRRPSATPDQRRAAIRQLGQAGGAAHVALPLVLETMRKHKSDYNFRQDAQSAAKRLAADKRALPLLRPFLRDIDLEVSQAAIVATEGLGTVAVGDLAELVEELEPTLSREAAQVLARLGPKAKAALPALKRARDGAVGSLRSTIEDTIRAVDR